MKVQGIESHKTPTIYASLAFVLLLFSSRILANTYAEILFGRNILRHLNGSVDLVEPTTQFNCYEEIHTVFKVLGLTPGLHQLEARWTSPVNKLEKLRKLQVRSKLDGRAVYLSSFIKLPVGGSFLDQDSSLSPYLGTWKVTISSDGQFIGSGQFEVLC